MREGRATRAIGLAGWSGAGKATLIAQLLPELARRGLSRGERQAAAPSGRPVDHRGGD